MNCPKCGSEIDEDLEEAIIIVLSSPYIRDQDENREQNRIPGERLDALLWYARLIAQRVKHECGHEEKVKDGGA